MVQGKGVCDDKNFQDIYPKECCAPYTCQSATTRTSICVGTNIAENGTCWKDYLGTTAACESGLLCLNEKCTNFTENPSCVDTGVEGYNVCYNSDINMALGSCCPDLDGATTVYCLPSQDTSIKDRFCMNYAIASGKPCGADSTTGHIGYCATGLACLNGVCATAPPTTTPGPTTTTPACIAAGSPCWTGGAPAGDCCSGVCPVGFPFTNDYNCP